MLTISFLYSTTVSTTCNHPIPILSLLFRSEKKILIKIVLTFIPSLAGSGQQRCRRAASFSQSSRHGLHYGSCCFQKQQAMFSRHWPRYYWAAAEDHFTCWNVRNVSNTTLIQNLNFFLCRLTVPHILLFSHVWTVIKTFSFTLICFSSQFCKNLCYRSANVSHSQDRRKKIKRVVFSPDPRQSLRRTHCRGPHCSNAGLLCWNPCRILSIGHQAIQCKWQTRSTGF